MQRNPLWRRSKSQQFLNNAAGELCDPGQLAPSGPGH